MAIKLVSFKFCPYVQRAVIALEDKRVAYGLEYVDLDDPPAWSHDLLTRPSLKRLVVDDFTPRYLQYLRDKGSWLASGTYPSQGA